MLFRTRVFALWQAQFHKQKYHLPYAYRLSIYSNACCLFVLILLLLKKVLLLYINRSTFQVTFDTLFAITCLLEFATVLVLTYEILNNNKLARKLAYGYNPYLEELDSETLDLVAKLNNQDVEAQTWRDALGQVLEMARSKSRLRESLTLVKHVLMNTNRPSIKYRLARKVFNQLSKTKVRHSALFELCFELQLFLFGLNRHDIAIVLRALKNSKLLSKMMSHFLDPTTGLLDQKLIAQFVYTICLHAARLHDHFTLMYILFDQTNPIVNFKYVLKFYRKNQWYNWFCTVRQRNLPAFVG